MFSSDANKRLASYKVSPGRALGFAKASSTAGPVFGPTVCGFGSGGVARGRELVPCPPAVCGA